MTRWGVEGTDYSRLMAARLALTAIYETVDEGWTQARLREIPAVITAARTRGEAKELLQDALREYLLSLGDDQGSSTPVPADADTLEIVIGS